MKLRFTKKEQFMLFARNRQHWTVERLLEYRIVPIIHVWDADVIEAWSRGPDDFDVIKAYTITCPRCYTQDALDDWLEI